MKGLTVIFFLFCVLTNASAQDAAHKKIDTLSNNYDPLSNPKYYPLPIIIIDDKIIEDSLSKAALNDLKPIDILEITVLKDSLGLGFEKRRDTVCFTTKIYAQKQYQKKLSVFSKRYKKSLASHKNNDDDLDYVLNGNLLERKANGDLIKKLYDIPIKKIISVTIVNRYYKDILNNRNPVILITTNN